MPPTSLRPSTLSRATCSLSQLSLRPTPRSFTTTASLASKTVTPARLPKKLIPPYPYGERLLYKQSNKGLYGHARIRFGNIVSGRGNKTRRTWKPNVHVKNYFLPDLGARVKTRLTLRVLKTINHEGGLENYLLKSKPARVKDLGPGGWNLRWLLMQTTGVQERMNAERRELGLPEKPIVDNSEMIHFALDYATPGPLSLRGKAALATLKAEAALDGVFALGEEAMDDANLVEEELTEEREEELLRELEKEEKIKTEKEGVEN
jgi:large subunit ribosomal protein L28